MQNRRAGIQFTCWRDWRRVLRSPKRRGASLIGRSSGKGISGDGSGARRRHRPLRPDWPAYAAYALAAAGRCYLVLLIACVNVASLLLARASVARARTRIAQWRWERAGAAWYVNV